MSETWTECCQRGNEDYKAERDSFIARVLPVASHDIRESILDGVLNDQTQINFPASCPVQLYPLFRDLFFAIEDEFKDAGYKMELQVSDDHEFKEPSTVQPTQYWFDLKFQIREETPAL